MEMMPFYLFFCYNVPFYASISYGRRAYDLSRAMGISISETLTARRRFIYQHAVGVGLVCVDYKVVMMSEEEYQASKMRDEQILASDAQGAKPPDKCQQKTKKLEDLVDVCPSTSS